MEPAAALAFSALPLHSPSLRSARGTAGADLLSGPGGGGSHSSWPLPPRGPFFFLKNIRRHVPGPVLSTLHIAVLLPALNSHAMGTNIIATEHTGP